MTGDLLELLTAMERADDPRADLVHICLPSMGYVCGGDICGLPDGGPGGHQVLGAGSPAQWAEVNCPDCKAPGRREVARISHRQQKPLDHVCADGTCHWLTIPEDDRP